MRTSLGLASDGLLDQGLNPALHIASLGYLRTISVDIPDGGGGIGAGDGRRWQPIHPEVFERIEAAKRKVKAASWRELLDDIPAAHFDVEALEQALERAFAALPPTRRKVDLEGPREAFILPIGEPVLEGFEQDDYRLELLLLLGT